MKSDNKASGIMNIEYNYSKLISQLEYKQSIIDKLEMQRDEAFKKIGVLKYLLDKNGINYPEERTKKPQDTHLKLVQGGLSINN